MYAVPEKKKNMIVTASILINILRLTRYSKRARQTSFVYYIKANYFYKIPWRELGFVYYIKDFTISKFTISSLGCTFVCIMVVYFSPIIYAKKLEKYSFKSLLNRDNPMTLVFWTCRLRCSLQAVRASPTYPSAKKNISKLSKIE